MCKDSYKKDNSIAYGDLFPLLPASRRPVEASFTAPDLSSRGGLSLMREYDRQTGFPAPVNKHVEDDRCSYLVKHPCGETVTQRACRMASGYEDADGCGLLRYGRRNKTANITGILIRMTGLV